MASCWLFDATHGIKNYSVYNLYFFLPVQLCHPLCLTYNANAIFGFPVRMFYKINVTSDLTSGTSMYIFPYQLH